MIHGSRVLILILLVVLLVFFWNSPVLVPVKVFVVYLHEISHALAAYLTGGEVLALSVNWNESGYVRSRGGVFPVIAMAGYLGSMIWGSVMLHLALKNTGVRALSLMIGVTLLVFTLVPDAEPLPGEERLTKTIAGLFWGGAFVVCAAMFARLNHALLFFMGGLTSLYSLYDLDDFFAGTIMQTDAGILARYLFPEGGVISVGLAYAVAGMMSVLSVSILYFILRHALRREAPYDDDLDSDDLEEPYIPGSGEYPEMPPEVLRWFDEVKQSRGQISYDHDEEEK